MSQARSSVFARVALVVAMSSLWAVFAPSAMGEEPDRPLVVTSPENEQGWEGQLATGANTGYSSAAGEPCGDGVEDQCDTTLLRVDVPAGYWDDKTGGLRVSLDNYLPLPSSDFDLYVYRSDAGGKRGALVDGDGDLPGQPESVELPKADGYYLVQVVYYAVTASKYTATTDFFARKAHAATPPDVDDPPGLQDSLASDPALGYRSHSEPHIAQSPTNPNLLVAASKQYNKDPDSLAEYEFKIGTYVSFDGGRTWTDLGQTNVCPPQQAPPESWPNNSCYPEDDPNAQGTGVEDPNAGAAVVPEKVKRALAERGLGEEEETVPDGELRGSDYGEEYITSDAWVQFDDEGNAYLMVLDSPPFEHGNGWGMSFHRWETPSAQDVTAKKTWSNRIPINSYANEQTQPLFLDDKNTFAVNNAGPDRDGKIGTMVACWGQNIPDAIKQQTVCERSTDGGRTWPGLPVPISDAEQLVIGVSVVADNVNPNRFYATWMHYTTTILGAQEQLMFSQSLDGGLTWTPASLVTQVTGIPRSFPGQDFRNLTIPIMAAGPKEGELYTTYAEYRDASSAEDEDGMQADTMLVRSSTGGLIWSAPSVVNEDTGDADQFQPSVTVTPAGQVNVSWFDRRHDPDNFFIDTYLARSNDGGTSFTETRVSHDMWDPDINPPISPSGEFIGDYQGLVADDCAAIPFVNDTHLANDASRDPDFDSGMPRSQFQQVFSWRVPNTARFGGPTKKTDCKPSKPGNRPPKR